MPNSIGTGEGSYNGDTRSMAVSLNPDGTPDKSARPKNNPNQDNVLTLAKNALEYLKTR